MNLIAYSDSEGSDNEAPQPPKPTAKPASKATFQKAIDRSTGKIKLNLPTPTQPRVENDGIEAEERPAKKARTGGGAFGGFNAMLPAPKKPNVTPTSGGAVSGSRGLGKGLGSGVNLRTGAEPAFKREAKFEEYDENGDPVKKEEGSGRPLGKEDFRAMLNLPLPKTQANTQVIAEPATPEIPSPVPEIKPAAKPRFMPLSVARGKKKKPMAPRPAAVSSETSKSASEQPAKASAAQSQPSKKPKVSLFSVSQEDNNFPTKGASNGDYQPLLYGVAEDEDAPVPDDTFDEINETTHAVPTSTTGSNPAGQDLTSLASELNLTEAERRRLFGRKGHGPDLSGANVIDFNTDTEYAHNEMLRQQGETVQHNALKSISGTGKNSLRSLINVATTQKDALEEHFAAGRRNKREAGNKYGW